MIGRTNVGGGGKLNYSVICSTSEPSPKENCIWVNTSTASSGWTFSSAEPSSPSSGHVWFMTGADSLVAFSPADGIWLYPVQCQQYIGGAWVSKVAKSYLGGAWCDWWSGQLYDAGNEWTSVTGGWQTRGLKGTDSGLATAPTVVKGETSMTVSLAKQGSSNAAGVLEVANDIDLTDYSTVSFDLSGMTIGSNNYMELLVFDRSITVVKSNRSNIAAYTSLKTSTSPPDGVYSVDVSGLSGSYDIALWQQNAASSTTLTATIHKVWLE